jgi:hypothetical protein
VLGIWDVCPGSRFFHPRSNNNTKEKGEKISCPFYSYIFHNIEKDISKTTKNLNNFNQNKIVTKLIGWIREPESESRDTEKIHSVYRSGNRGKKITGSWIRNIDAIFDKKKCLHEELLNYCTEKAFRSPKTTSRTTYFLFCGSILAV